MIIEFKIPQLLEFKLTFEEYFLLYCVNYSQKDVLLSYVKNIKSISDDTFSDLKSKDFLDYKVEAEGSILFSSLKIGDKAVTLFPKIDTTFDKCFTELRQTYPKKFNERPLQTDIQRCITLYKKAVLKKDGSLDVEKHKLILKCVILYVNGLKKTGKLNFLWALPTYLNQQNWETYMEEASKMGTITNNTNDTNTELV